MSEKIEHPTIPIDRRTFVPGKVFVSADIHLTGGLQARSRGPGLWAIGPLVNSEGLGTTNPQPLALVHRFASEAGLRVIGGDETTHTDGPLLTRFWTPQYGPKRPFSPADEWASIASNARRSGDDRVAQIARKISVSLTAAGIRVRDASDAYHAQLVQALLEKQTVGHRFANTALLELFLDFHSLLTEMGSARDYIAEFAGHNLGGPDRIDGLARFEDWVSAQSRQDKAATPLAAALIGSHEPGAANAWLGELTSYRNLVVHKMPLGAMSEAARLTLTERQVHTLPLRTIEIQIPDLGNEGGTCEALTKFVGFHEQLLGLAAIAADQAPYSSSPPSFVVS